MDYVQALCEAAGVLPCIFDAAAFRYDDDQGTGDSTKGSTTRSGYINRARPSCNTEHGPAGH